MRYNFVVAGLAAIANAQDLDVGAVDAAPAPIATGPAITAVGAETITCMLLPATFLTIPS